MKKMFLSLVAAVAILITGCGWQYGKSRSFNKLSIYHTSNLSEWEVGKLGAYFLEAGWGDNESDMRLNKEGETYHIYIAVQGGTWDDPDMVSVFKEMGEEISEEVYKGSNVVVYMCSDNNWKVMKALSSNPIINDDKTASSGKNTATQKTKGVKHTWDSFMAPTVNDGDIVVIDLGAADELRVPDNATITIIGDGAVDNIDNEITINIPATSKVIWKAGYTGIANKLINISGIGVFEIAAGAKIIATDALMAILANNAAKIVVSGGEVKASGSGMVFAIAVNEKEEGNVTVSSGLVSAGGHQFFTTAIYCRNVTVSGGTVRSSGTAISAPDGKGNIIVSGGEISALTAIDAKNGAVMISGGNVVGGVIGNTGNKTEQKSAATSQNDKQETQAANENAKNYDKTKEGVITAAQGDPLNLRACPKISDDYKILAALERGTIVAILGTSEDGKWYKVKYNDLVGFANSRFISER